MNNRQQERDAPAESEEAPDAGTREASPGRQAGRRLGAILVALVIAATVGVGFLSMQQLDANARDHARAAALETAPGIVVNLLSYDWTTIESLQAAADELTPEFRTEYLDLVNEHVVPSATEQQIQTVATVVEVAVTSVDRDEVTLLFFINQETESNQLEGTKIDGSRVRVVVRRVDGRWLVHELTPV